jgi:hypothetical protein
MFGGKPYLATLGFGDFLRTVKSMLMLLDKKLPLA